jgi:hypothetical protein
MLARQGQHVTGSYTTPEGSYAKLLVDRLGWCWQNPYETACRHRLSGGVDRRVEFVFLGPG